jgi:hypothetical protein
MELNPRRYVSREVQRRLRQDARDRCSLSGHLLPIEEIAGLVDGATLEQHHVIYFSEGGGNGEDNLMLVCPNCHAKIHRNPQHYTAEKLREAKRHWIQLASLVPPHLRYAINQEEPVVVAKGGAAWFSVETTNLIQVGETGLRALQCPGHGRGSWWDILVINVGTGSVDVVNQIVEQCPWSEIVHRDRGGRPCF